MNLIEDILNNKALKGKAQTEALASMLLEKKIRTKELAAHAAKMKDPAKATCIEAIEFATKQSPELAGKEVWALAVESLKAKAPRVKWESAKVIANIAHLFKKDLSEAIINLLDNTEHSGTVVRWSAAYALGQIIKLNSKHNADLIPAVEAIIKREEKNSIRKIYEEAVGGM